ncbi:MAG: peptidoglycan-binding protein [Rhodocyclaceae bacterium]|nr:peptidoglycan-binding protein [Rhodocyclaceae bacterium]
MNRHLYDSLAEIHEMRCCALALFIAVSSTACKTMEGLSQDLGGVFGGSAKEVIVPRDRAEMVKGVQTMLSEKGFNPGTIDGKDGPGTRSALRAFQKSRGMTVTSGITDEAYLQLASDDDSKAAPQAEDPEDSRECARNFAKQQGFRNYRTTATLQGTSPTVATNRLVRELGRKGFIINSQNPSAGQVNATFDAGQSDIQISAFIERNGTGSRVELNYVGTGAGFGVLFTPASAYRNDLCSYIEAMGR